MALDRVLVVLGKIALQGFALYSDPILEYLAHLVPSSGGLSLEKT